MLTFLLALQKQLRNADRLTHLNHAPEKMQHLNQGIGTCYYRQRCEKCIICLIPLYEVLLVVMRV